MITYIGYEGGVASVSSTLVWTFAAVFVAVYATLYVLRSIGLYVLAKRNNVEAPYLAWIPFVWIYTAAKLCGSVRFFEKPFKNFALFAVLVCGIIELVAFVIAMITYIPIAGFYLQGGEIIITSYKEYLPNSCTIFDTGTTYLGLVNFYDPYSEGFWAALSVINYVVGVLDLLVIILQVMIYSNIFKNYLPRHSFIATLFSFLGFFGPFIFAVRNNEKFDYAAYMKRRYQAFYGNQNPNGGQPFYGNSASQEKTPFDEFDKQSGEENKNGGSDDPFDEFKN